MKLPLPTEYEEQCLLVDYLELKHLKFSKIAQETFTRSWGTVIKNKRSGVRKGVPDLLIIIPERKTGKKIHITPLLGGGLTDEILCPKLLFLEMKRKKGGKVSPEQDSWLLELGKIPHVVTAVCYGFEEAKLVIDQELKT